MSGLDFDEEPEGEEAFNVPTPHMQEDLHSEEETASGVASGGAYVVANTTGEEDGEGDDDESMRKDPLISL